MKIAFIGIGLLGLPMAEEFLKEKHKLFIFNRTKEKANYLSKYSNAKICNSPEEAISKSEIIVTVLTNFEANLEILKNVNSLKNKTFFQMGTITIQQNIELENLIVQLGGKYIEAPVLGSNPQIKSRTLITLVGSTEKQFLKWKDFLSILGSSVIHMGEVGKASAAKLALNQLIASLTASFSMSLGFIQKNHVDVGKFMTILRESALYAPTFDKKLNKMLNRDFTNPNFPLKHLLKDVELINQDFQQSGVDTKMIEALIQIINNGILNGDGDLDYSAIFNSINP